MYLRNKYKRWYDQLIERARKRRVLDGYCEKHHVRPKSLGGSRHPRNRVALTYREHFLAHWLLTKFTKGRDKSKMHIALIQMARTGNGERIVSSWQYDVVKRAVRAAVIERREARKLKAEKNKKPPMKGRKMSKKRRAQCARVNKRGKWFKGHKHSEETKLKMSEKRKGRPAPNKGVPHSKSAYKENIFIFNREYTNIRQRIVIRTCCRITRRAQKILGRTSCTKEI